MTALILSGHAAGLSQSSGHIRFLKFESGRWMPDAPADSCRRKYTDPESEPEAAIILGRGVRWQSCVPATRAVQSEIQLPSQAKWKYAQ